MSRRDGIKTMSQEVKDQLSASITSYNMLKIEESKLKKEVSALNDYIKTTLTEYDMDGYDNGDCVVTSTTKIPETLNEDKAIEILKANLSPDQLSQVIITKEALNEDALEKLIYNKEFNAELLVSCKEYGKPVTTLRIKKSK